MASKQIRLNCGVASNLDSTRWIKLSKGLDDFRFGPPKPNASRILPASPGILYGISETPSSDHTSKTFTVKQPLTEKDYARNNQKLYIQSVEKDLIKTPSILFPYSELDIPNKIFENILFHLDLGSDSSDSKSIESYSTELKTADQSNNDDKLKFMQNKPDIKVSESTNKPIIKEKRKVRKRRSKALDPYRSFLKRINYSSDKNRKKVHKVDVKSPAESETNLHQIVEDFCNWTETIGGEQSEFKLDVNTVLTLFTLNAEINEPTSEKTVEKFYLTPENSAKKPYFESKIFTKSGLLPTINARKKEKSELIRCRYGAWYLNVNQWKKMEPGEILEDPKKIMAKEIKEAARCSPELDKEISKLNTCKELTSFIRQNKLKLPKFLPSVLLKNAHYQNLLPGKNEDINALINDHRLSECTEGYN